MRRARDLVLVGICCFCPAMTAQEPADPPAHESAIRAWLASDHSDRALLEDAVGAVLDAGRPGLEAVAREMRATEPDDRARRIGIDSLVANVAVGALERARESQLIFAGQFDDLRVLQPEVGRFLLGLVLDTPEWFPEGERVSVIPALRDLYPSGPPREYLERLADVARDEELETQELRVTLSYALHQWGRPEFVADRIARLEKNAGDRRTADELHFVRELAELRYMLREYGLAADLWREFLDGTRALEATPHSMDLYNAACAFSLSGRLEESLDAIEACTGLIAAGDADRFREFTREMFETDPDLRNVRPRPRFAEALEKAFGKQPNGEKSDGR